MPILLKKDLSAIAISLGASLNAIAQLVGTFFGGIAIVCWGIHVGLIIDGALFLVSSLVAGLISLETNQNSLKTVLDSKFKNNFIYEINYIKKNQFIHKFCFVAFFLNFVIVPLNSLQSPLADLIYNSGSELVSIIGASIIVGNCIGPIAGNILRKKNNTLIFLICGIGIGIVVSAYSAGNYITMNRLMSLIYCGIISLLLGIFLSIISTLFSIKLIESINPDYMARTSSIMNSIGCLANPIAALTISIMANIMDVGLIFIIWGAMCTTILTVIAIVRLYRLYRY